MKELFPILTVTCNFEHKTYFIFLINTDYLGGVHL